MLLEYEKESLENISHGSCLTILARGFTCNKILEILLSFYSTEDSLVFILNMNDHDIKYYSSLNLPHFCNITKLSTSQRGKKYNNGGIFYGTSRVLISDFVNRNVNISKISTLFVLNAEIIDSSSNDAFICYLFKENNSLGLIRAFSSQPIKINDKNLEIFTKLLCLSKVQFFPRFHEKIKSSIVELDVDQVFFKQPEYFGECVIIIEELIKKILSNESKSLQTFDFASVLIRQQHNSDVKNFKKLLVSIFNSDLLSTYLLFKSMIEFQKINKAQSGWIFVESSHVLFDILKNELVKAINESTDKSNTFVFDVERGMFKIQIDNAEIDIQNAIYQDILANSKHNTANKNENLETVEDEADQAMLEDSDSCGAIPNDVSDILESKSLANFYLLNLKIKKVIDILDKNPKRKIVILVSNRSIRRSVKNALSSTERFILATVLTHYEFQFSFESFDLAILFNPDLGSIRHIEYLSSTQAPYKTIIFQYKNSIEEQRFLQEIREEKSSFEKLIDARLRIPLRIELEKVELDEDSNDEKFEIVVDSREMRAKLPFFLYKAGNAVTIKVIDLGDYLIGKNKCIERKSIDDFISSLNTGRLYQQAQRLAHNFKTPILLIEFDDCKPVLSDFDKIEEFKNSYIARFCLFLFNFPSFQVIWSNSPIQSVRMIRDIQKKSNLEDFNENEIDPALHEILLCIPGISSFNVTRVSKEFRNLKDLAFSDQYRLEKTMDPVSAAKVFEFFRQKFAQNQ